MSAFPLILKEVRHRKVNFLLAVLAVAAAVAMCVAMAVTSEAAQRETRRLMVVMGFNIRVIPKDADVNDFLLTGFSEETMPQGAIERIAQQKNIAYNHLIAILRRKIDLQGGSVILEGISGELCPPGAEKAPMIDAIEPGTVHVGYRVAQRLDLKKGDPLEIAGETFTVARTMPESGNEYDVRVMGSLTDVQRVLKLEDRINEIQAIDCLCQTADQDPVKTLRAELAEMLPEAQVFHLAKIADARARQRQMAERYSAFTMPLVLLVCAGWVGVLATINVRQRCEEIGILRALGYRSGLIGTLFLGKALLIGIVGAVVGYGLGTWLSMTYGPRIFVVTAKAIQPTPMLLAWSVLLAPVFAAVVSVIPTVSAVVQDPAETLRPE